MTEESNSPLRVPLLRQRLMELVLRPTRELIKEEVAPLKRRIAELEWKVADLGDQDGDQASETRL